MRKTMKPRKPGFTWKPPKIQTSLICLKRTVAASAATRIEIFPAHISITIYNMNKRQLAEEMCEEEAFEGAWAASASLFRNSTSENKLFFNNIPNCSTNWITIENKHSSLGLIRIWRITDVRALQKYINRCPQSASVVKAARWKSSKNCEKVACAALKN